MSSPVPPLPSSGNFIASIRDTARSLRQAEHITIPESSIRRLLLSPAFTRTYHRISTTSHGLALPLNFPSPLSELNLLSLLSLLNIASGYRIPLHQQTGRGAWDSIRAFVFGLYLTSSTGDVDDLLSAKGMMNIGDSKIAELLGVSLHTERPHETISGVTVGEVGGPGWELTQLLKRLMNETGAMLLNGGYKDLGGFVVEALQEGDKVARQKGEEAAAEVVLERLVRAIPGFQDMAEVNGQPIYCFKKALFLINGVNIRFGSKSPPPFPVPRTSHIPVFTDNVLPSILIHLGVINLSTASSSLSSLFPNAGSEESLASLLAEATEPPATGDKRTPRPKRIPHDGPVLTTDQAYILRAAAIDACELIVEYAHSMDAAELRELGLEWIKEITLPDLDTWIWAVAKDREDYRKLERFVLRDTVFF
ncbi:hypothetical protein BV25DRAFT_1821040 [Artomyces pyxidatus]|uniref:Uncharacterized protein n=1 Tax=Artomyces pyxidatus TaxID=48021 RepID=A0ACB8TBG3_9AGAM|nr:hypothetical protein BV25DRAFT_1821040 [Artomyces pyxidatus]